MVKPKTYSVVLDGTNAVTLALAEPMVALELIPDGIVSIEATLGDGQDPITLQTGAAYSTPAAVTNIDPLRLRLTAGAATTLSVVAWPR